MEYLFPMALEYGMTSKEFWQDDPNLFSSYRTFFINKSKRESEISNNNAWLFGLYNFNAFAVNLSNMFKKKGDKAEQYLQKPIDFNDAKSIEQQNIDLKGKLRANLRHFAKQGTISVKDKK